MVREAWDRLRRLASRHARWRRRSAPSYFPLDALRPRQPLALERGEYFHELAPAARSHASRVDQLRPDLLSPAEVARTVVLPQPVRPLGFYKVHDVVFCGRAYALRDRLVCYSRSVIPQYWRVALDAGRFPVPNPSGLARRDVGRPAILFAGRDYNNYGHWWLDIAPRLHALRRQQPRLLETAGLVIPSDLSGWGRDVLSFLFDIRDEALEPYDAEREGLRCETAIIPTMVHTDYHFHPLAAEFYRAVAARCAGSPADVPGSGLLFVTRGEFARAAGRPVRVLANADDVEALATSMGFTSIAPERLSWREQVAVFSKARIVVGEHGSAMKNLLFAPEGAIAVVINYLNSTQAMIAALKRQHYILIEAEGFDPAHHQKPFRVDLAKLRARLERALLAAGA